MRTGGRIEPHVPQNVLDSGRKTGFPRCPEISDITLVDRPDVDHVAAAPRVTRLHPNVGEHDSGVVADNGILNSRLDVAQVLVGSDTLHSVWEVGWLMMGIKAGPA